mmetsp:Transcript_1749/g.3013  ORF Transcript_1749/g.3013 Transcript_1749/m.3013 type:complete len:355 (+) Transcript_1749:380-1444(+)
MHVVLVGDAEGSGEVVLDAIVDDGDAGRLGQDLLRVRLGQLIHKLEIDALGVRPHGGHAHAGGGDGHVLCVPDLGRLLDQLKLLLVVARGQVHPRVVREQVERVLAAKDSGGRRLAIKHLAHLRLQLRHGRRTRAGCSLVGGHHHALHGGLLVDGGDGHEGDDGGAVGVGDDGTLLALALAPAHVRHGLRVHLRDHQRHALRHAERRAVVHHDDTLLHAHGPELLADASARREQRDVHTLQAFLSELLDGIGLALPFELLSRRPGAGKHLHFAVREVPLRQHREKLLADGACDTGDRDDRTPFGLLRGNLQGTTSASEARRCGPRGCHARSVHGLGTEARHRCLGCEESSHRLY